MSLGLKKTTNLTGLAVVPNARKLLIALYNKILRELQKMPESSGYRRNTEALIKQRHSIAESESSSEAVEKKIGCGQIEELLIQAENELNLARKFSGWKPWQQLTTPAPKNQWKWPIN